MDDSMESPKHPEAAHGHLSEPSNVNRYAFDGIAIETSCGIRLTVSPKAN
jgi:hypothetical protein